MQSIAERKNFVCDDKYRGEDYGQNMNFNFFMPTAIFSGEGVIRQHAPKFALGKKCIIVTGKNSAKASGALGDVFDVLMYLGIKGALFDKITENPLLSTAYEGGRAAAEFGAEFVIAIGGGSPLDAAKAIAAFATNPDIAEMDLFSANLNPSLPIIAIPTTAGTGSEANPYAIMSLDGKNVKKTFNRPASYPVYAFLDPRYTDSLGLAYTVSTALDAFCHCAESYLSPKSTEISRAFALLGAKKIYPILAKLAELSDGDGVLEQMKPYREDLLTAACEGGIAINATGTGFNHPLGYNLTMYNGVSHGRACGAFMQEYYKFNQQSEEGVRLITEFCAALGDTPDNVAANIVKWAAVDVKLTDEEIALYVDNVKGAGNYANSPYVINEAQMKEIYERLFK